MFEIEVSVPFRFSHHLEGFGQEFAAKHEHIWNVTLTTRTGDLDRRGVSLDFVELKKNLASILEPLQGKVLNNHPPFDNLQPTAEHLAQWVATKMDQLYPALVKKVTVGTETEKARLILE